MGEAKTKRRAHAKLRAACPNCVYCGGETPAETIDHMPPRMMFWGKHRPKGLEFSSCRTCNASTKHADLVASMIGRAAPDATTLHEQQEFKEILTAVSNNIPGLLQEMEIGRGGQKFARKRLPIKEGGFLRVNGPLVSSYMQQFSCKLGFALFYEVTKSIVPKAGGVAARWFSNVERIDGTFPQTIFDFLLPPTTLKQGQFHVSDQFEYSWRVADDNTTGMFFASFRRSFAVLAFTATDANKLEVETNHPVEVVRPGQLSLLRP